MKISPINTPPYFCAAKTNTQQQKRTNINPRGKQPISNGLSTAGAWFGFGVGLDFISRKITFSKSPLKNSIAVNGIISAAAGTAAGISSIKSKNKTN